MTVCRRPSKPTKPSDQPLCDRGGKGVEVFEADLQVADSSTEAALYVMSHDNIVSLGALVSKVPKVGGVKVVCRPAHSVTKRKHDFIWYAAIAQSAPSAGAPVFVFLAKDTGGVSPFVASSCKPMLTSNEEDLFATNYRVQEVVTGPKLRPQAPRRMSGRLDL